MGKSSNTRIFARKINPIGSLRTLGGEWVCDTAGEMKKSGCQSTAAYSFHENDCLCGSEPEPNRL